jgi:hypothetical protein
MTRHARLRTLTAIVATLLAASSGGAAAADGTPPVFQLFQVPAAPPQPGLPPGSFGPPAIAAGPVADAPSEQCRRAIIAAATRFGVPRELMLAISLVESGRTDPVTGLRGPWPWTADKDGQDYRFETQAEAAAWLRQQQARGAASIDAGCMQVNLRFHPDAFATAEEAFDPVRNADYAARFLRSLYDGPAGGDWRRAVGFYHSQTPDRAEWYRGLVETALRGPLPSGPIPARAVPVLGGGGQSLSNHAERAAILPAPAGQVGRSLDAYRAMPILIASRQLPAGPGIIHP